MKKEITYLDLFSGLGAFAKGLRDAGFKFKNHYYSEIDKHAIANYSYNFKNAKNLGDVQKIKHKEIQRPDIITFGSPCQDISHSGLKTGIQGKRSKLFFDALEIINQLQPSIFVFENVKGLFFSNKGKDFEVVLREIANLGLYDCQWQLINTAWFLPQNRERVFIVGSLRGKSVPSIFPLIPDYQKKKKREAKVKLIARSNPGQSGRIFSPKGISPTLMAGYDGNGYVMIGKKLRRLTPVECERIQGLPDDWTKFGIYEGIKKEISNGQRYKLLGNAITSLVIQKIGIKLLERKELNGINNLHKVAQKLIAKLKEI
jgi:DNA (cytosine-5)-methyltransferase 1